MAAPWSDRMIFISQPLIDWALKERICGPARIEKIYSGIETDRFVPPSPDQRAKARSRWQIGSNDRVIGIVSKLWEGKGHHTLIEALPGILGRVPDARLMIVGEGQLRQELEAAVKRRSLERAVIFTGFQAEVQEVMAAFDISVLPSFFEGMGRVLLEAMAMEIPVVASRVGGIPDLVSDGENGYLVEAGRSAGFATAIAAILENPEQARRMGRSGRQMVTERFSADFMVRAIEKVYVETLAEKGLVT
jgi:glycosyltransferase involved in cell wall biosynthesis